MKKFRWGTSHPKIDQIVSQIDSFDHSLFHEKILFGAAIDKTGQPKPAFVKVEFVPKSVELPKDFEYDYGDYCILQKSISMDEFKEILSKIEQDIPVNVAGDDLRIVIDQWDFRIVPSNKEWGFMKTEYPTHYFEGRLNDAKSGKIIQDYLGGKNNPPYPTADKAIAHLLNLRVNWQFTQTSFLIVMPDIRARIQSVKISGNNISAKIESTRFNEDELEVQYYVSTDKETKSESSITVKNGIATISYDGNVEEILVVLSTKSGEILDHRDINLKYQRTEDNVEIETTESTIEELLSFGEGRHIEFKSDLKSPEPFISSVISFANTDGGRIFIGVNDNGEIIGVKNSNLIKEKVIEWIGQYCDPRIDVKITHYEKLNIVVVEVPLGDNRPYYSKSGGCFIRHGSTDRLATRVETEQMSGKNNSTISGYGL